MITNVSDPSTIRAATERCDYIGMQARFNAEFGQKLQDFLVKELSILDRNVNELAVGEAGCLSAMLRNFVRITAKEDQDLLAGVVLAQLMDMTSSPDWLK